MFRLFLAYLLNKSSQTVFIALFGDQTSIFLNLFSVHQFRIQTVSVCAMCMHFDIASNVWLWNFVVLWCKYILLLIRTKCNWNWFALKISNFHAKSQFWALNQNIGWYPKINHGKPRLKTTNFLSDKKFFSIVFNIMFMLIFNCFEKEN